MVRYSKGKEDKIVVVVGTVTDDDRMRKVPALKICALKFTDSARTYIIN